MTEWRDIPGYEGSYQASDDGQVRSLDRIVDKGRYGPVFFRGQVLKPRLSCGYRAVDLKGSKQFVHRLVALTFIPDGQFEGAFVLHGDGNRENNALSNLRWGTASDNNSDTVKHGTHSNAAKAHCPQGHPYDEANTAVHAIKGRGRQRICRICKRKADRIRDRRRRGTTLKVADDA